MNRLLPLRPLSKRTFFVTGICSALFAFATCICSGFGAERHAAGHPAKLKTTMIDGEGVELVLIQPGQFFMGGSEVHWEMKREFEGISAVASRLAGEGPLHQVEITKPFYMGKYEVTVGQFERFVDDTTYKKNVFKTDAERNDQGAVGVVSNEQNHNWRDPGFEDEARQQDNHPVVCVSWNDANDYCKWLSHKEKKKYRLPTEAEWEYACRAGTATMFHNGGDPDQVVKVANVCDLTVRERFPHWPCYITGKDGHLYTAPVGSFEPNAWGLCDMHGNAWEWCQDRYVPDFYITCLKETQDPVTPDVAGPIKRVGRGGSWAFRPLACRSGFRCGFPPAAAANVTGFRVVREP